MMNVVNAIVAPKADTNSSSSAKATRSNGDDGFAKTLNSYGNDQDKGAKADSDSGSAATAKSGQDKSADTAAGTKSTDSSTAKNSTKSGAAGANGTAGNAQAAGQAGQVADPATADASTDLPVSTDQQATATDTTGTATDTGLAAATDLLADLQAAVPTTKGQSTQVNTAGDKDKTGETDQDGADATDGGKTGDGGAAEDVLAILQAVPDASTLAAAQAGAVAAQTAQAGVAAVKGGQSGAATTQVGAVQPQVDDMAATTDTDILAARATGTGLPLPTDNTDTTLATSSTVSATAVATAATDTAHAAKNALAEAIAQDTSQSTTDDSSTNIDLSMVTVTDSRRYIGLAPSSNALSLATAFGQDPDWSAAMDPSAKLSNEALYASTGKVVNTLTIALNPGDLGQVTATMRMVGEQLNIHLTVENSKAYKQITSDSSSMLDNLKAHGYSVDQITVSISSASSSDKGADTSAGGRQSSDMSQAQQQQQQQQSGRQGGSFSRSAGDTTDVIARGSSSGGRDEGLAQGNAVGSTDSRPDHVYL